MRHVGLVFLLTSGLLAGCGDGLKDVRQYEQREPVPPLVSPPDTRQVLPLSESAVREHRDVMLQHLETLDQIVGALAKGNFVLAEMQANAHASFFERRMLTVKQRFEDYPPNFQQLALNHQTATDSLAASIPSKDFGKIIPALDGVLKACTACHRAFVVRAPDE
ncbi:hypothetical protein YTPLAS18_36450 [Nitrospira sp.]|nr:hypothetical protein YTPLAS18_36450 [Nitrospira sp.]